MAAKIITYSEEARGAILKGVDLSSVNLSECSTVDTVFDGGTGKAPATQP